MPHRYWHTDLRCVHAGRNVSAEFKAERIAGSQFFDIDGISDTAAPLPHMLPSEEAFAAAMDALGITNESNVVVGGWA